MAAHHRERLAVHQWDRPVHTRTTQSDTKKVMASDRSISRSLYRAGMLVLLVIVAAAGLFLRGDDLRTWWLSRYSLTELRAQAQHSTNDPLVWYLYGQRLLREGQADTALPVFQQAAQALPSGPGGTLSEKINAYSGYLLARQGQTKEAMTCLDYAHKLNDEDPMIAVGYGILFELQNKHTYAVTQFRLASTLDARNVEAWFRLGSALDADSKFPEAADALRQAIALVPNDAVCHATLGHALAAQNQSEAALTEYRRAHDLAPDNEGYTALLGTMLAQSAHSPADYQEAARLLALALKQHPNDASLAVTLGSLHLRFNAPQLAVPYLERSVMLLPREAEGWYNLSRAQKLIGNTAAAAQAQKRFLALRDLASEMSIATKHIATELRDPGWRVRIAKLYIQQGNPEAARAQYAIALGLQPTNAEAKQAFNLLTRRLAQQKPSASGTNISLGPPPPPGLQIYDPDHTLPSFHPEVQSEVHSQAAQPSGTTPK